MIWIISYCCDFKINMRIPGSHSGDHTETGSTTQESNLQAPLKMEFYICMKDEQHGFDTHHSPHHASTWALRSRCIDKSICHHIKCFTAQPNRPPTNQPDKYTTRNIQTHYFSRTCRFMTDVTFCSDNIQNYIFCSGNNTMTWGKLPVSSPEIVSLFPIPF